MSTVTLFDESRDRAGGFYVPRLELRIEGSGLPRDVLRDVISFTYKDNVKELDSFEMTVNNWDPTTRSFKYIGSETNADLKRACETAQRYKLFEPCNKTVEVRLGYGDQSTLMMTGNFTTMEPSFTSGGGPTLTVRGLNVLHQLRRKQYTYAWPDKRYSEIAREIQSLRDNNKRRFPLPIAINENALSLEDPIEYVAQENQYDIDFLLNLARKAGYVVYVQEADEERGTPRQLYFGPSNNPEEPVTFQLEWNKSLIDFKPTITTANQVKSVTVNGWDRGHKKPIKETATLDDKKCGKKDLREILQVCDAREERVVNRPVFTKTQAKKLACALLKQRNGEMIKATGTTVGLPDLRAGRQVVIEGIGARLSRTYFITESTHTYGDSGYTTSFKARWEDTSNGGSQ